VRPCRGLSRGRGYAVEVVALDDDTVAAVRLSTGQVRAIAPHEIAQSPPLTIASALDSLFGDLAPLLPPGAITGTVHRRA
jgi:hypothetical protein